MPSRRRTLLAASALIAVAALTVGCAAETSGTVPLVVGAQPGQDVVALPTDLDTAIENALAQVPELAQTLLDDSGVPGMAVAVVHGGVTIFAEGFGEKLVGSGEMVDAETVFQIASLSKSLAATTAAKAVTDGAITWDTPVIEELPEFTMSDPYVTENATIGDYFSHRSGLATGSGDILEDLGYDREYILARLQLLPLAPFRTTYQYSNFGFTVGGEAVAASVGMSWEDAAEQLLYEPLGMTSTSSRYADFVAQTDRATIHALTQDGYQPLYERNPDAEAPAGSVSSNVIDLAAWMNLVLAQGELDGEAYIAPEALLAATSREVISSYPSSPEVRVGSYGYGFNIGSGASGRVRISHSGAFVLGTGTNYQLVPDLDLGIVVLTNGSPVGIAESLTDEFLDLVQYGYLTRDWAPGYEAVFAPYFIPAGDLVDATRPTGAASSASLTDYVGTYTNEYFGDLVVSIEGGILIGAMGPGGGYTFPLEEWDGDEFAFIPTGESAPEGSLSSAVFARTDGAVTSVTMAYFDTQGWGTFARVG
ncbi:serine hydrolase [Microbacterium sediminicola]|uniref:Serine hydrolase n=1 Tax=Microbacterium sediminicola TaxID=415210 RepID=A0ABN2HW04_9MICO